MGTEDGSGTFSASVCLPEYDPTVSYFGLTASTKRQAEMNAAEAALQELAGIFAPLEEEHKAKKARQSHEKLALFKQKKSTKDAQTRNNAELNDATFREQSD